MWFEGSLIGVLKKGGWTPADGPQLGFQVGGYSGDGIGRIYDVKIPGTDGAPEVGEGPSTANTGVVFEGQTDVIGRLLAGFDAGALTMALEESGTEILPEVATALEGLEYALLSPSTVQDAIDCAAFLIRTTIGMQRFTDGTINKPGGVPGCGGAIRVLAITRKKSDWVARPALALPV